MFNFLTVKVDIVENIDPSGEDTQQGVFRYLAFRKVEQLKECHDVATRAFLLVPLSLHAFCAHDVEPRRDKLAGGRLDALLAIAEPIAHDELALRDGQRAGMRGTDDGAGFEHAMWLEDM